MNLKKKQSIIFLIVVLATIALAVTCGKTYAKYILTKHFDTAFSSYPFYFEVEDITSKRIKADMAEPDQVVSLNIKNYLEDQVNAFDTKYIISLEENEMFTLDHPIEGTISASEKGKTVTLNLKLKQDFTQTGGSITFVINTTEPYTKEIKVVVPVNRLGDYVTELANDKTCTFGNEELPLVVTDFQCDMEGYKDTIPPYHKYLVGTDKCLDFNYVWYSGYMWRITEILNDGSVKMITENVVSAVNFGETGFFDNSYIKQWLNEDFLDTLNNYDDILVTDATWDISHWYSWCYVAPPHQIKAPVGLLNSYEFNKTASYGKDSFLNLGHNWWFSSPIDSESDSSTAAAGMSIYGALTGWKVPSTAYGVRPVVVLKADVKFSGEGTKEQPFVLLDDIEKAQSGDLINTRTPGELVEINNMLYRIVNIHDQNGQTVTKLKSANYVTDEKGVFLTKPFGDMIMKTYKEIVDSGKEEYWGAYLNGSWLEQQDIKKYLVQDTYYVAPAQVKPEDGSNIGSYKNTICKDINTTETTKACEKTDKTWTGYVGLPIVGELFAYPLGGSDTVDHLTATMTPYGNDSYPMIGAFVPGSQGIDQYTHDSLFAVKPCITLKEEVIITGGDGKTPETAFKIALPGE